MNRIIWHCSTRPNEGCSRHKYLVFIAYVLLLIAAYSSNAISQSPQKTQRKPSIVAAAPAPPLLHIGGRHKPSLTVRHFFRVLVLFVRFNGDTTRSETWPDPEKLPLWGERIVDRVTGDIGKTPWNLSEYYRQNSNGKFRLIGDVFYVTLDSTEEYYHRHVSNNEDVIRGRLVKDALNSLYAQRKKLGLNLRRYDNWASAADFRHTWKRDGLVDLIWFITRSYSNNPYPSSDPRSKGYTNFARTSADFMVESSSLSFSQVRVSNTQGIVTGSGSGLNVIADNTHKRVFMYDSATTKDGMFNLYGEIAHEFSHYLFGAGHFGNTSVSLASDRYASSFSGLSVNSSNAFGHHHGLEKLRLGWITERKGDGLRVIRTDENDVTVRLEDVSVTGAGKTRLVKIPVEGSSQYFLLENRGWKGSFEPRFAPYNSGYATLRPGILLTHVLQEDDYFYLNRAQVKCADGKFAWHHPVRKDGDSLRTEGNAIEKGIADPENGYDEREKIYPVGSKQSALAGYWTAGLNRPAPAGPFFDCTNCRDTLSEAADNTGDAFDLFQTGDVITPWSNPAMNYWDGKKYVQSPASAVGIHIVAFDAKSGAYTIRIRRRLLDDIPPARPTGLRVSDMRGSSPVLRWSPNREPRFVAGGNPGSYEIQRAKGAGEYVTISSVRHPLTEFVDRDSADLRKESVRYRLRAVDAQGTASNYSEPLVFNPAKTPPFALRPFLPWWNNK